MSGCIEHTSVITQIIKEARQNKGELAVIWLDLANAYGTIPHKLVELTLARYHVPEKFRSLIQDYYARFNMRFTVNGYTTALQRLEIGIITGCTISVIIFAAAVNLLLKSVENQSRGAISRTGTVQPPTRAFMDDMTVMTRTIQQGRWTLNDLNDIFTWARMRFKPVKSRSLVIKKGRPKKVIFTINGVQIPTVEEKPIKCLGKWYNITGSDKENVEQMVSQAEKWLQEVDKSGLPGTYKAWSYQHGILPRLTWPMFIYDIPISAIEKLERRISSYLRRWLNVPRMLSSIALYGKGNMLQLPLTSLVEEFKVTKVRQATTLRNNRDEKVRTAGISVNTGRKWQAAEALNEAEGRLRQSDLVGTVTHGRLGLGCITRARWKNASDDLRRELVQSEVRQQEEENRKTKAVSLKAQGS